jgi:transketolase
LALTRQAVPLVRMEASGENKCAKGAYVLAEADGGKRNVTLLATGSEVAPALEARQMLLGQGIRAAVVSMPCWELFASQPVAYRDAVLGVAPRVGVEAAVEFGWSRWTGDHGAFVGMQGFGASAPAPKLYEHFGITAAKVAETASRVAQD